MVEVILFCIYRTENKEGYISHTQFTNTPTFTHRSQSRVLLFLFEHRSKKVHGLFCNLEGWVRGTQGAEGGPRGPKGFDGLNSGAQGLGFLPAEGCPAGQGGTWWRGESRSS